jgi:hypothetical protein
VKHTYKAKDNGWKAAHRNLQEQNKEGLNWNWKTQVLKRNKNVIIYICGRRDLDYHGRYVYDAGI